ncbi:MAG: hypothetical protein LBD23_10045 [Oscillospiraceae bacterium]|jgi:hypothetical protein|nr:hypothetical protein [Oscillospiraceae bacterium]
MLYINILSENPWITLISIPLALIGLILTLILYFKGKRKKSIKYYLEGDSLFEDFVEKINGLSIQFFGKQIKTLTVTKIVFWNSGTETINREDFPTNDIFYINIEDGYEILDVSIIRSNNQSNNIAVSLSEDEKKIKIDFEYLDPKNGFILQIFHTSTEYSSKFNVNGSIKGFGKLSEGEVTDKSRLSSISFVVFLLSVYAIFGITIWLFFNVNINDVLKTVTISLLWLMVISFIMMTKTIKIPKELQGYSNVKHKKHMFNFLKYMLNFLIKVYDKIR